MKVYFCQFAFFLQVNIPEQPFSLRSFRQQSTLYNALVCVTESHPSYRV